MLSLQSPNTDVHSWRRNGALCAAVALIALGALGGCSQRETPAEAAARTASIERGKDVSNRYCSICHEVTPAQPAAIKKAGPGFAEIANRPGRNRANLLQFMSGWHELGKLDMAGVPMPTILLTDAQRNDVISHILSFQLNPSTGNQPAIGMRPF